MNRAPVPASRNPADNKTINSRPQQSWQTPVFTETDIGPDREKAIDSASARQKQQVFFIFSDPLRQHNDLGAAVVALDQSQEIVNSRQICIGRMGHWSVYAAELMASYYGISLAYQIATKDPTPATELQPVAILSDSMSALQAIKNMRNKS